MKEDATSALNVFFLVALPGLAEFNFPLAFCLEFIIPQSMAESLTVKICPMKLG